MHLRQLGRPVAIQLPSQVLTIQVILRLHQPMVMIIYTMLKVEACEALNTSIVMFGVLVCWITAQAAK